MLSLSLFCALAKGSVFIPGDSRVCWDGKCVYAINAIIVNASVTNHSADNTVCHSNLSFVLLIAGVASLVLFFVAFVSIGSQFVNGVYDAYSAMNHLVQATHELNAAIVA